jgi:hypothetical protein
MLAGVELQPDAIYDDGALVMSLGIASASLVRARRTGQLRYRRVGQRCLYLGRWVLDWLNGTAADRQEVSSDR